MIFWDVCAYDVSADKCDNNLNYDDDDDIIKCNYY